MKIEVIKLAYSGAKALEKDIAFTLACNRALGVEALVYEPDCGEIEKFRKQIALILKKYKKQGIIHSFVFSSELSDTDYEGAYMLNKFPELPGIVEGKPASVCVKL